jgi:hypothetical protein
MDTEDFNSQFDSIKINGIFIIDYYAVEDSWFTDEE